MCNTKPPINKPRLRKKEQEKEDKIKGRLKVAFAIIKIGSFKSIGDIGICNANQTRYKQNPLLYAL